jgi:hypothetical protein
MYGVGKVYTLRLRDIAVDPAQIIVRLGMGDKEDKDRMGAFLAHRADSS